MKEKEGEGIIDAITVRRKTIQGDTRETEFYRINRRKRRLG